MWYDWSGPRLFFIGGSESCQAHLILTPSLNLALQFSWTTQLRENSGCSSQSLHSALSSAQDSFMAKYTSWIVLLSPSMLSKPSKKPHYFLAWLWNDKMPIDLSQKSKIFEAFGSHSGLREGSDYSIQERPKLDQLASGSLGFLIALRSTHFATAKHFS